MPNNTEGPRVVIGGKCYKEVVVNNPEATWPVPGNHMNEEGEYCVGSGCTAFDWDKEEWSKGPTI